jgi:minor extracellular protease Epr
MSNIRNILVLFISLVIISGTALAFNAPKTTVIINFKDVVTDQDVQMVKDLGGEIKYTYKIIPAIAASVPSNNLGEIKRHFRVSSIDDDVEVKAMDINGDNQINASSVWKAGFTGQGVRVAILDTGITTVHTEFSGRIAACKTEVPGTSSCEDDNGHGTHVAGIAGAQGVNPSAKGVAPSISFMSDKVLDSSGSGSLAQVIAGIQWATYGPDGNLGTGDEANVISMSLGTSQTWKRTNCNNAVSSMTSAINTAVNNGVTVVAAAGNSGGAGVSLPGCISTTIAVGAVDFNDVLASFSGQGFAMKDHGVVTPGVGIFSTWLNNGYNTLSGTSMATPAVAGTVALLKSANPSLTPADMKTKLFNTAKDLGSSGVDNKYGNGRIDAYRAYICATGGTCTRP